MTVVDPSSLTREEREENLTQDLLQDAVKRMRLSGRSFRTRLIRDVLSRATPRFARFALDLDDKIGAEGIAKATLWTMEQMSIYPSFANLENVPRTGPTLILSNHPGNSDFMMPLVAANREDAKIIASIHQLKHLIHGQKYFIFSSEVDRKKKGETTRIIIEHLKAGACVVLFPHGKLEPDPRWSVGARRTLLNWSNSMKRFVEAVPDVSVVPMVSSGTAHEKALNHWFFKTYRNEMARARNAVVLQTAMTFIQPGQWKMSPHAEIGRPIQGAGPDEIRGLVFEQMNQMITQARAANWPLFASSKGWF